MQKAVPLSRRTIDRFLRGWIQGVAFRFWAKDEACGRWCGHTLGAANFRGRLAPSRCVDFSRCRAMIGMYCGAGYSPISGNHDGVGRLTPLGNERRLGVCWRDRGRPRRCVRHRNGPIGFSSKDAAKDEFTNSTFTRPAHRWNHRLVPRITE